MSIAEHALTLFSRWIPLLSTFAIVAGVLALASWTLTRRWREQPDVRFRFKLIMLGLTSAGFLAVIMALPIPDSMRGQLLGLIGILLSAAIALSSTTFIGNVMAGIMLKTIKSVGPGDFITVADLTGRITLMHLLHTEIQTEFRDLVTVPNLFMVTQPMKVVRASGTIVTAEVSLGYDVEHSRVFELLCKAAQKSGLVEPFVQVRELGDFAVTYRVAGLLESVKSLISARSRLREAVLDALHEAQIEIVSPNFMNTRSMPLDTKFIPEPSERVEGAGYVSAEELAFDKAEEAESVEALRKRIATIDTQLAERKKDDSADDSEKGRLERQKARLVTEVNAAEEHLKARDPAA